MKRYTAKTLDEAKALACKELEVEEKQLMFEVVEEKKGLFIKKATITVYEIADVIAYCEEYLKDVLSHMGLEVSIQTIYRENIIKILIETDKNSLIIGKNGATLQSLNELVKLAASDKFKRKFRILLDIGDYKNKKYSKVISVAKKAAREVLTTHMDVKLDYMTADERKKVHNALSSYKNIKTESVGDGKERAIVVKYVANEN